MVNDEVIENQQRACEQVDAKYTVVVSGAGAICEEKPVLEALLPGIRLHFLRYGLFPKHDKNRSAIRIHDDTDDQFTSSDTDASNGDLVSTDNFLVARTPLNKGYVYLINADNINDYHELEVDEVGNLSHVVWNGTNLKKDGRTPKDFRTKEKKSTHYKLVSKTGKETGKKYWIGYSPIQWSYNYHQSVLNSSDEDKRQKQMILVECKGVKKGEEEAVEHVLPYHKVEIAYYKDHGNQKIVSTLRQIHQNEKREETRGNNEIFEDMFISLHDPVGCATDLSEMLSDKFLDFKALTEAIQTGETEEDARIRLLNSSQPAPAVDKAYQDMYTLALVTYQMVYSSKKNTQKYDGGSVGWNMNDTNFPYQQKPTAYHTMRGVRYKKPRGYVPNEYIGSGVHRTKVEGILGVQIRKKRRAEVNVFRDEYGNFICSTYFKQALKHYTENSPEHCLSGIARIHEQLLVFFNNPYDVDRHLLIKSDDTNIESYKESDIWIKWILDTLEKRKADPNDPFEKLLIDEYSIKQVLLNDEINLMVKFAGAFSAKLQLHASLPFDAKAVTKAGGKTDYQQIIKERQTKILKKLNKITVIQKETGEVVKVFKFGNSHMIEFDASKLGIDFDPNLEVLIESPGEMPQKIIADKFAHKRLYGQKAMAEGGDHKLEIGERVESISETKYKINEGNARRFNAKAAKFLNSRGFTSVLTGLQLVNFTNSVFQIFADGQTKVEVGKDIVNAAGVSADLTQAFLNLRSAHLNAIGKKASETLGKNILRAGAIGGAVTSAMCIWDGVVALNRDDEDAGAAWIGAGVAFGVGTAASIWGSSVLLLSGPVGWIALGIGFGLVILANVLTDSDLEYYFKHFILCDRTDFELDSNESPMHYNRRIFKKRTTLVDYSEEDIRNTLMHPTDAIATLHDLTVCNSIQYHIPRDGYGDKIGSGHAAYRLGYEVTISINFNQFLENNDQLEAVGVLLNSRGNDIGSFDLVVKQAEVTIMENGQKQLNATLALPDEYKNKVNRHSNLVVALRICIDKKTNHYFPCPMKDGLTRYMGACIGLMRGMHGNGGTREQEIIFDTLYTLKKEDTW